MIRSMTGFGRARATVGERDISVEVKSVNGRFLDCNPRLPRALSGLEERIKPYLQSRGVVRGKVDVNVTVERVAAQESHVRLDPAYLEGYLRELYRLRDEYGLRDDISVMKVAANPMVFRSDTPQTDLEEEWSALLPVLGAAVDGLLAGREREGKSLADDLRVKLGTVRGCVKKIEALSADSVVRYRERLAERVRDALADNRIDPDESRLLTEVAIFADRVAVDEELVRLRTHFSSMEAILGGEEPVGRPLDFLLQEMNREINTTGSKCNDAAIAALVVKVKHELEKMREQVQNLE